MRTSSSKVSGCPWVNRSSSSKSFGYRFRGEAGGEIRDSETGEVGDEAGGEVEGEAGGECRQWESFWRGTYPRYSKVGFGM